MQKSKSETQFFQGLCERSTDYQSPELRKCIEETVDKLLTSNTTANRPGMLLGKIQSGKTRGFIGVVALAFDRGYDVTVILTKGTKALAKQTYMRFKKEFEYFSQFDQIQFFDIMLDFPDNLSAYEIDQKMIIVVKKQKDNLTRLHKVLFKTYPELSRKKVLIIDDEADYASIGFSKQKNEQIEIKTIAGQIDNIRKGLPQCDFLQVTATPYSLYLQPEELTLNTNVFQPIKPEFTVLLPVSKAYIGGDYYFSQSKVAGTIASYIHQVVSADEFAILKQSDRRSFKIEEALTSKRITMLRNAIVNFVVGGCIRRLQCFHEGSPPPKYSFIVHTEQAKASHEWQETIVRAIQDLFSEAALNGKGIFDELLGAAYNDIIESVKIGSQHIPKYDDVREAVIEALQKGYLMISRVNSDNDVETLLDDAGQLKLRTPLNVFIGGQILDRGITIANLIGFYYGRKPNQFQQDTVLQHSRMYGYRSEGDLRVTRFYTTQDIHDVMERIEEFDSALREAFEQGNHDRGVIFIQKDKKNQIIPCSPNKILLSETTTLRPGKRLLPVGFQTGYKTNISKITDEIKRRIAVLQPDGDKTNAFLVDFAVIKEIINLIEQTLIFSNKSEWSWNAFLASIEYLANNTTNSNTRGKVWIVVRENREIKRLHKNGRFEDSPDTGVSKTSELTIARKFAVENPALILLHQKGRESDGWRDADFWWPILVVPSKMKTVIFADETIE